MSQQVTCVQDLHIQSGTNEFVGSFENIKSIFIQRLPNSLEDNDLRYIFETQFPLGQIERIDYAVKKQSAERNQFSQFVRDGIAFDANKHFASTSNEKPGSKPYKMCFIHFEEPIAQGGRSDAVNIFYDALRAKEFYDFPVESSGKRSFLRIRENKTPIPATTMNIDQIAAGLFDVDSRITTLQTHVQTVEDRFDADYEFYNDSQELLRQKIEDQGKIIEQLQEQVALLMATLEKKNA